MGRFFANHADMVRALKKPGRVLLAELTPEKADVWHAATGIATEAGELLSQVKAHVVYGRPIDLANVQEELGDLEFYIEQLRQALCLDRGEILDDNIEKLETRYGQEYSNAAAIARADKPEGQ